MRNKHQKKKQGQTRGRGGAVKRHNQMLFPVQASSSGSQLEVDLHGLSAEDADLKVTREIGSAPDHIETIRFIHGYRGGKTLKMVVHDVALRLRKRSDQGLSNPGITIVHLD